MSERVCLLAGLSWVFWYSWIMDDAYVYFRYVDNWIIHGRGLVWNPGEYVEGFSSPLWTLFLGLFRFLHLDYWVVVRLVGLLSFALFWYLACIVHRGLLPALGERTTPSFDVPLVYLSFHYGVTSYFTSGLEAPLVNVSAALFAAAVLWPRERIIQFLLGVTPLVRHELALPLLLYLGWVYLVRRVRPVAALGGFCVSVVPYGVFRIWYYADLFPNTYYLKDTTWITQGLAYLYDTLLPYFTVPFLAAMALAFHLLAKSRSGAELRRGERLVMLLLALSVTAYVIKIGGGARHFRCLAFPFVLVVLATGGLLERWLDALPRFDERIVRAFLLVFALAVALCYPRQLQQHPMFQSRFGYGHEGFLEIHDAAVHRLRDTGLTPPLWALESGLSYERARSLFSLEIPLPAGTESGEVEHIFWRSSDHFDTVLLAAGWCQLAYRLPASPFVHTLGLTDPFLARTEMALDRPAHALGLVPLAEGVLDVRAEYGFARGAFDRAIADGVAPAWAGENLEAIRRIEARAYNDHRFLPNLVTALGASPRIDPGGASVSSQSKSSESSP